MIGVAAHIAAAASGPGARRYDPTMTHEQRSHIDNGIWLCVSCSVLIDRDEKRFDAETLRKMRREHEASRRIGSSSDLGEGDIIAIGPRIIAIGDVLGAGPTRTHLRVSHFVEGTGRELLNFANDFIRHPRTENYVLINELGCGYLLEGAPSIERHGSNYDLHLRLQASVPREDASARIVSICPDTFKLIEGMDAVVQLFESTLGMARGTWFLNPEAGSNLSDLYWQYKGSPWFKRLAMMEMARLASIPNNDELERKRSTSLKWVNRVNRVEVPSFELEGQKLRIVVEFDIEGHGPWSGELSVFISTLDQLTEDRAKARLHYEKLRSI